MDFKTISNEDMKLAMMDIYNNWFNKYKKYGPNEWTEPVINRCIYDMDVINSKYDDYPIVGKLLSAFWQELCARQEGGYRMTEEEKLLNKGFFYEK